MIFIITTMIILTLIYTKFYSFTFFDEFLTSNFGIDQILVIILISLLFAVNLILDIQVRKINKTYFNKFFKSSEEYHMNIRKHYRFNSINRFLMILFLPILVLFFFYLYEQIFNVNSLILKILLIFVNTALFICTFGVFYVVNILLPFNLLICGDSGFSNYCEECHYGGFNTYMVEKGENAPGYTFYKCKACGKSIKIENFRHVIITLLKNVHILRHH